MTTNVWQISGGEKDVTIAWLNSKELSKEKTIRYTGENSQLL